MNAITFLVLLVAWFGTAFLVSAAFRLALKGDKIMITSMCLILGVQCFLGLLELAVFFIGVTS